MAQIECCPRCQQPLPSVKREGVYLPAKKAAIFDTIQKLPGITAEGIIANCFDDSARASTVRAHINQINNMLEATSIRIRGENLGGREPGGYRIVRVKVPA